MRNKPKKGGNYTLITEKIEYEYSLDDQVGHWTRISRKCYCSVGWSSIEVFPFAAVSNCPTPVSTCGVPIR